MRVVVIALLTAFAAVGCHKSPGTAPAQAQAPLPSQEVNWNQSQTSQSATQAQPSAPVVVATAQVAVNGSNVTAQLSNVRPGTELTLAWFGPNGWHVTNQQQVVSGNTVTFPVPKFATPGRYEAELLDDVRLLGTVDVNL